MKNLPVKGDVTPYLPTPSITTYIQSEAGNRAQSVAKQAGNNTGANGDVIRINWF